MNVFGLALTLLLFQAPETSGSLQGTVVRSGTDRPVSGAQILIAKVESTTALALGTPGTPALGGTVAIPIEGGLKDAFSARADANGMFVFRGVPRGTYRVFVEHRDYVLSESGQTVVDGQERKLVIPITPAGAIYGRVFNQYSEARRNFTVRAMRLTYERGVRTLKTVRETQTNDLGEFRLFGLAPGRYYVGAVPPPLPRLQGENFTFGGGGTTMGPAAIASGRVPASLFTVEVDWPVYYGGATQETAAQIVLRPGETFDAGTLLSTWGPRVRVRGQLIDERTGQPPASGARAAARSLNAPPMATDAPGGVFDFFGLPPGSYLIRGTGAGGVVGTLEVVVGNTDIDNLRILLRAPVSLSGRVSVEGAGVRPEMSLTLTPEGSPQNLGHSIKPGQDGAFRVPNVSIGEYRVGLTVAAPYNTWYLKAARLGTTDVLNSVLRITGKIREPLEVIVSPNGAVVSGIVLDDDQRPVRGAIVVLVPDSPLRNRYDLYRKSSPDASGRVTFEGIPPGGYRIFSWDGIEDGSWQDPNVLRAYEDHGQPVSLREGDRQTFSLKRIPVIQ